ncbi:hypothetical protein SBADM41S_02360 [Streptomyces badius]
MSLASARSMPSMSFSRVINSRRSGSSSNGGRRWRYWKTISTVPETG